MRKGNNLLASNALFVCLLAFAGIALSAAAQTTAPNEWTWMGGNSTISLLPDGLPSGQPGVYGTLGTPAPGDIPGSRTNTLTWTDGSGNFWLFGGLGYDSNDISGELNDLWKFNPATNLWTWMGGSSSVGSNGGQPGVYGTLGTPAAGNVPGGRSDAATWTDGAGNLWLFGGASYSSAGLYLLKDLWEFYPSTNEWAWMGGINLSGCGSSCSANGEYGTLGTPAAGNIPGGRENAVSWIDGKGNFWRFGGLGFDGAGTYGYLNDLWEFYPSTNEWAWMGGSSTMTCIYTQNGEECSPPGVYGTLGTPAAGNIPSGRAFAANWTDSSGNFWLFGGFCLASSEEGNVITSVYFNDLWEMNPSTNEWAWMAGSNTPCVSGSSSNPSGGNFFSGQPGVYGTLGTPAAGNIPGGRDSTASWIDGSGNLWLFGGIAIDASGTSPNDPNDLWEFNPSTNEWTWMGGSGSMDCIATLDGPECSPGVYGTLGTPAAGNIPGSRNGAAVWTDTTGNLWLFGGGGVDSVGNSGSLNDLWKYQPSATTLPPALTPAFSLASGAYVTGTSLTISDEMANASFYYTIDGSTPTTASTLYNGPITLSTSETIQAIADAPGYPDSGVATATYVVGPQVATPIFSVAPVSYTSPQTVTITDVTPGAAIYYTTNDSTPTSSSTLYTGPISVSTAEYFMAIAVAPGFTNSPVVTALIFPPAPTPAFSVPAGTYISLQTVTISDAIPSPNIYYTINGTTPTTSSTLYTRPITVSSSETIEAIATGAAASTSLVASATYTINLPLPSFTVSGSAVTVAPGATAGNTSTITLTPAVGFTGNVALTAAITSSPSGAVAAPTLSFGSTTPVSITGTTAGTATLSIATTLGQTQPCTADNRVPRGIPWCTGGGAVLACVLLFGIPARRRNWRRMAGMVVLLLVVLAGGMSACGGGGGKACVDPTPASPSTTAGAYTITVTGTSGTTTATGTVTLNVQ